MPRRGGVRRNGPHGGVRPAPASHPKPGQPPGAPGANAGPPSAPRRRDPVPAAPVTPTPAASSTGRSPSARDAPGLRVRPSPGSASRAGGHGPSRGNHAGNRHPSVVKRARSRHMNGHSGVAADSTTTNRSRILSTRRPALAARHTTRCHGCATAAPMTKIIGWNIARGLVQPPGARRPGDVTPGSTTTERPSGPRRADLPRQGEHQGLVGGGHRLHGSVAVVGEPLQHTAHQHLGHRGP